MMAGCVIVSFAELWKLDTTHHFGNLSLQCALRVVSKHNLIIHDRCESDRRRRSRVLVRPNELLKRPSRHFSHASKFGGRVCLIAAANLRGYKREIGAADVSGTEGQESVSGVHDETLHDRVVVMGEVVEVYAHGAGGLTPESDAGRVTPECSDVVAGPFNAVMCQSSRSDLQVSGYSR